MWLVRAGQDGEYEDSVLNQGLAIVDWGVPDLTDAGSKDTVKERVSGYNLMLQKAASGASQANSFHSGRT